MSDDNPFQSPQTTNSPPQRPATHSAWRMTVGILLLIGILPATPIAFFCCCLAGVAAAERPVPEGIGADTAITAGMIAGSAGGLLVFALMLWGGIVMIRRSKRP